MHTKTRQSIHVTLTLKKLYLKFSIVVMMLHCFQQVKVKTFFYSLFILNKNNMIGKI